MRALPTGLALLALYILCVAAAALAARWLERPVPRGWLLILALPPLLFLRHGFLQGKTLLPADHAALTAPDPAARPTSVWSNDVARQFAPWAQAVRLAWERGDIPHRNRWSGCGTALAANGSSSAYFPPTFLGLLVPLPAAFTFWAAVKLFLCLAGTWLWLGELGLSRRAALFGSVAFSFSLSMTAWLSFPQTAVLSLWPWVLWTIERLREPAGRDRAFALLVLLFFLLPLAGHIETVASASALTGLWLATRLAAGDREQAAVLAVRIAGAAVLALGLSAFSLLPQAIAIGDSNRLALVERPFWSPILSWRPHGPGWAGGLLTPFFPRLFGDKIASPMIVGAAGAFPEMALGCFGIVGIALAALLARPGSPRPAAERALLAPLCFGLGAAVGLWPFAEIASFLPGLGRMFPLRFLTWVALAGSAIAAFELDRLAKDLGRRRRAGFWPIAAVAAALLLTALTYGSFRSRYAAAGALPGQQRAYLLAAVALAAALAVLAATARRGERFAAVGVPLLTLIVGAELYRQGRRLNTWSDPEHLYPATPLVQFLRARPGPFRIAGEGAALFPNVGVFAGLEDVRTHDAVERRDYVEFLDATCGYDPGAYFKHIADVNCPALDFLNVRYLVSHPGRAAPSAKWKPVYSGADGTAFENTRVLPRLFAPESVRVVTRSAPSALREFDWSREAVVLPGGPGSFSPSPESRNGQAEVTEYAESTNSISFRARTAERGGKVILVASLAQDGGWRARDERGATIPTGRVNGPFLALSIPGGDHRIRLDYSAPGFRLGAWISVGWLALAAAIALGLARRGR